MNPLYIDLSRGSKGTRISVNNEVDYHILKFHNHGSSEKILDHIDQSAFKGFQFNLAKSLIEKNKKSGSSDGKNFNYGNYLVSDVYGKLYAISTFFPGEPDTGSSLLVLDIEEMESEKEFAKLLTTYL